MTGASFVARVIGDIGQAIVRRRPTTASRTWSPPHAPAAPSRAALTGTVTGIVTGTGTGVIASALAGTVPTAVTDTLTGAEK
jgi:hypothetical protein